MQTKYLNKSFKFLKWEAFICKWSSRICLHGWLQRVNPMAHLDKLLSLGILRDFSIKLQGTIKGIKFQRPFALQWEGRKISRMLHSQHSFTSKFIFTKIKTVWFIERYTGENTNAFIYIVNIKFHLYLWYIL